MRRVIRFALILALVSCAGVGTARADNVDDYVNARMRQYHVPGLSLAVVRDGKLTKAKGYGLASVELFATATPETVYEIGSVTKPFTATAIMILVEEGKVRLDDPLTKYLDGLPDSWNAVTVRHLLTHTSGIRSYFGLPGFELRNHLTREQFIKTASVIKPEFPPGDAYLYSNTGYSLLGFVIERASGKPYWEFIGERILKPLGMSATTDRNPVKVILHRAAGYEWERDYWTNRDADLTDVFSAGAIVSNVLDLAKWDASLYTETVLKKQSLDQMWTPLKFNDGKTYPYGFGWGTDTFRGHRLISHGGLTAGFSANISRFVDDRLTVIILSNLGDIGGGGAGHFARSIAALYLPALSLKALKELPLTDARLSMRLRAALQGAFDGKPDMQQFTKEAQAFLSSESGKALLKSVASHGALKSLALLESKEEGSSRRSLYRGIIGPDVLYFSLTLAQDGKISALSLEEE
jgi:D-alanyl-D-alanine carboxypeptidase